MTTSDDISFIRFQSNRTQIRYWLYFICVLVAIMVIVGGATRLTDSGLSITEWKPLLGVFPPLSLADWTVEFEKYKLIPQYLELNKGMSLGEFQAIYWWEWSHRFLGRFVGIAFAAPFAYFWLTGRLESGLKPRLLILLTLGALQGAIGWWMVSSGLVDRTDVSQYRLAVHLVLACLIFAYALWIARSLVVHSEKPIQGIMRTMAALMVIFTLIQIFLGALVAGLNAGLAFNDWPLMDGAIIPQSLFVMEPRWLNFFENGKLVQFTHRMSAYALIIFIFANFLVSIKFGLATPQGRRSVILVVLAIIQAALGIITLINQVPISWALFHQFGAVVLLGFATAHWRGLSGARAG